MFQIVEHEEQVLWSQGGEQRFRKRLVTAFPEAKRLSDGRGNKLRVLGSRQRNQHDTTVVARFGDGRHRERQPGLAHAAWAYQGQQAIVRPLEQGGERRDLTFATNEGGQWGRQWRWRR